MLKPTEAIMVRITICGLVQGVGFRPFIFRLARTHNLTGHVLNSVSGVSIEAHGQNKRINSFIHDITLKKPYAAVIHDLQAEKLSASPQPPDSFSIQTSAQTGTRTVLISPDLDLCGNCLAELFDPENRRYLYPFINCTNCGPRYTLIQDLPYDRPQTTMKAFGLCPLCLDEYQNPEDRRFHAQPNACPVCGPRLLLLDKKGLPVDGDPLQKAKSLLAHGKIVAVKGIGGFHLAVDAANQEAVLVLRSRKGRPEKPMAVMPPSISFIESFALCSATEKKCLTSPQKPIVLLDKKTPFPLAESVSPNNSTIGVMLPYSPVHHLLFHNAEYTALVMTSANLAEEPIAIDNDEALTKLENIADFFLIHDREILTSNDDSVLRVDDNQVQFIRRSRSYAPAPVHLDFNAGATLAVGGALKNTVCLTKNNQYFLSQHIGDLEHLESIRHFESVISHLRHVLQAEPDLVVHDLHPDYPSTRYALASKLPTVAVQHHHAHAVGCMAEYNLKGPVIAVILDGTGYGPDNTIWGGEILLTEHDSFERAAHFMPIPLPGGDQAVKQPWRVAVSYLYTIFGNNLMDLDLELIHKRPEQVQTIIQMMQQDINSPLTSSCGRLFDGVAAILGLREAVSFEGQAAIDLEMTADKQQRPPYSFNRNQGQDSVWQISFKATIKEIIEDIRGGQEPAIISRRFHETISTALTDMCKTLRDQKSLNQVVLSGGVFQNRVLRASLTSLLHTADFEVFTNQLIPSNDGGLALGQAVAGRAIYKKRTEGEDEVKGLRIEDLG